METLAKFDLKNWKQSYHRPFIITRLIKANVQYEEVKIGKSVEIKGNVDAKKIVEDYWIKVENDKEAFKKGIKIEFSKNEFNVDFIYKKYQRLFPTQFYLPETWKGGKSLQTYNQTDFYSFSFVNITNSKTIQDGNYIYIKTLSGKIFIGDVNYILNPIFEENERPGMFFTFDEYLESRDFKRFSQDEFKKWRKEKKLFFLTQK